MLSHSCLVHGHSVPERGRFQHFDSRVKTFCELRKKKRVSEVSDMPEKNESHKVKVGMGNRNFHRTAISTFQKAYSVAKRKQEVQDVRSCNRKHIAQAIRRLMSCLILYLYLLVPYSQIHRLPFSQILWTPKQTKKRVLMKSAKNRTKTKRALKSP